MSVGPDGCHVSDLFAALKRTGVGGGMPNPGGTLSLDEYRQLVPQAVGAARREVVARRDAHEAELDALLDEPRRRLERWRTGSDQLTLLIESEQRRSERSRHIASVVADTEALIASMRTAGQPLLRVLALFAPGGRG